MRIQKEIENVERIENRQPVEPLTMEDAVIQHKKAVDKYEEERKEINKELDLDDDIEEKGFTGASKEPKKVSTPELKKMKLSESLFESLNEGYFITDFNKLKRILKKIADSPDSIVVDPDYTTIDVINGKNCYCIYANGIEDHIIDYVAHKLEDDFYTDVEVFDVEINSNNIDFSKLPDAAKEDLEEYGEEELNNSYYKCIALKNNVNESLNEGYNVDAHYLIKFDTEEEALAARDKLRERNFTCDIYPDSYNWWIEVFGDFDTGSVKAALNEDYNDELDRIRAEERRKKQKAFNDLGKEHDWEKEFEKAKFEHEKAGGDPDDLDFTGWVKEMGYSDNEYNQIMQYIDNQQKEKEYEDKLKADEKAKKDAEVAKEKAKQEKEEKTKKNLERIGKAANAPKDIGNALKKGLGNAGIHIG